jgi:hypothetical protein
MAAPAGARRIEPVSPVWQAILERESGLAHLDWVLHNEEPAYRVVLDGAEYLVLAERNGEQLILQRLEPWTDQLFYLASHEDTPEAVPVLRPFPRLLRQFPRQPGWLNRCSSIHRGR